MNKTLKRSLWTILLLFIIANGIAAIHAYKFTHYSAKGVRVSELGLSMSQKLQLVVTGVDLPRPDNKEYPKHPYTVVKIPSNVELGCWYIPSLKPQSKGTVLIFHGYSSCKSSLIGRAEPFLQDGYNCLLVDFMGSGGSGGNTTTIGYKEAEEVKACYDYIKAQGEKNIFLYGSSMGAVAIMKAINDTHIEPKAIIIECPFATMYETVAIRFKNMGIPTFPMAHLLMFWGGAENGFCAYSHNPVDYAKGIHCPVLLQYGEKDERVARDETDRIFANLNQPKQLITYPLSGHDDYHRQYGMVWANNMTTFLNKYQ